jgi:hypothetical protein
METLRQSTRAAWGRRPCLWHSLRCSVLGNGLIGIPRSEGGGDVLQWVLRCNVKVRRRRPEVPLARLRDRGEGPVMATQRSFMIWGGENLHDRLAQGYPHRLARIATQSIARYGSSRRRTASRGVARVT